MCMSKQALHLYVPRNVATVDTSICASGRSAHWFYSRAHSDWLRCHLVIKAECSLMQSLASEVYTGAVYAAAPPLPLVRFVMAHTIISPKYPHFHIT